MKLSLAGIRSIQDKKRPLIPPKPHAPEGAIEKINHTISRIITIILPMKPTFLLSRSPDSDNFSHIISTNPVAIYSLPDFILISGDPSIREKAMEWYKLFEKNELPIPRLIPAGYQEALDKVRENKDSIDLAALAGEIGVSEKFLGKCINGDMFGGKTVHLGYKERVRFVGLVNQLEL